MYLALTSTILRILFLWIFFCHVDVYHKIVPLVKNLMHFMVVVKRFNVNQVLMSHHSENVLVRCNDRLKKKKNEMQFYDLDINECAQKPSPCKPGERCDNTPGSYKCVQTFACANGLEMKELQCLDIDECTIGNHTCLPPAICKNTYGSFYVSRIQFFRIICRE